MFRGGWLVGATMAVLAILASQKEPLVPLAYVRTLALAPPKLVTAPDSALSPRPPVSDKQRVAQWEKRRRDREQFLRMREQSVSDFSECLKTRLARLPGLAIVPAPEVLDSNGGLMLAGKNIGADAALSVSVDRFGIHAGAEREIWLRVVARLARSDRDEIQGPYHALGLTRSVRWIALSRFQKDDSHMVRQAADQAARQLVHTLVTGEEPLFTHACRVAILPAEIPGQVEKRNETTGAATAVALPALIRQRDVLLQPSLTPVALLIDSDDIEAARRAGGISVADLWSQGRKPALAAILDAAGRVRADYVFVSRVSDLDLGERIVTVQDSGQPREGLERSADAAAEAYLIRVSDCRVLWHDSTTGATRSRTEFVRHQARLAGDEQCAADAVRAAYGSLRFSFEDYMRRFER